MFVMWKSEEQQARSRRQKAGTLGFCLLSAASVPRLVSCILLTASCLPLFIGCRQDMQDQPKMKPFRSSTFFKDGLSSRQPVEGTVPRGFLKTDVELFTGKKTKSQGASSAQTNLAPGSPSQTTAGPQPSRANVAPGAGSAAQVAAAYPDDVETFPFPVTKEILRRGQERYQIFCSVCHGMTGYGDGMIVRRGFRRAASFHDDRLRQAPVGHFFDAVTNGWGAMPSYATQIPVQDRWAIIAYIRALQLSRQNEQAQLPPGQAPAMQTPSPSSGGHQR
jgi:mono/diheme cytochrome c family protein